MSNAMQVQPYLFFDGRCEEAVEFYKSKLGAKVEMLMRIKDSQGRGRRGRSLLQMDKIDIRRLKQAYKGDHRG